MKKTLPLLISVFILSCSVSKGKKDPVLSKTIEQNFSDASAQYKNMMKLLPPGKFPKTFDPKSNQLQTSGSDWWCSGFYPGTLLFLYEQTQDKTLLTEAERMLQILEKEKNNTGTHD